VYTYVMSRFMVQESFRGVSDSIVGVGTATNTLCEPKFKKGKRYLVYASLDDKTNQLFAGMCNGTTLAVDIDESLKELRKLAHREVGESISGRIKTNRYQGLPGIAVEVTSNDKTFKTMTTKYGEFSISLPSPGSFKVRVSVPYAVQLMDSSDDDLAVRSKQTESGSTFEYDVILEKSQCSYLELDVYGNDPRAMGTVAGNVLTATEQAVDDEDGRFNCILYGDYDYSIDANDYIDEIEGHSQRIKIPQGNSTALRLVIQRVKR
jgi:hypothetical protein